MASLVVDARALHAGRIAFFLSVLVTEAQLDSVIGAVANVV